MGIPSGSIFAHILDLETIGSVTSGLGQLSISDNWPQARLASQTIGSMKPWKKQNINKSIYTQHFSTLTLTPNSSVGRVSVLFFLTKLLATRVQIPDWIIFSNKAFFIAFDNDFEVYNIISLLIFYPSSKNIIPLCIIVLYCYMRLTV